MSPDHFSSAEFTLLAERMQRLPSGRPVWLSYTVPWADIPFLSILTNLHEFPRFYWDSRAHPLSLLGWGKAAELTEWGEPRFRNLQSQIEHISARLYPLSPEAPLEVGPRWLGGFSFRPHTAEDSLWQAFPDAYFILPRLQLARLNGQTWLTMNYLADSIDDPLAVAAFFTDCQAELSAIQAVAGSEPLPPSPPPLEVKIGLDRETWQAMVEGALGQIRAGEFEKVVLARTLQARFDRQPAISAVLHNLGERYPDCYRFMIEPQPGQVFLGASPELLAEVTAPTFRTTALAGTIRRGATPVEDESLGQELLNDPKERQEHAIVIHAIQNKLAPLALTVDTASAPSLRKLGNVQHLETAIHGQLAFGWGVLDVVAALHPTPAMGGWPQAIAQAYLARAEPFERGWYAAPAGWVDPWGNGLFAVGIRAGLFNGQTGTLFAGAGIVADSQPAREWQETGLKFKPLLDALGGAQPHG